MSELKPKNCWFCDSTASVKKLDYGNGAKLWGVFCDDDLAAECSHGHYIDNYQTKEEAIAAWNYRSELMCHPEEEYLDSYSDLTVTVCSNCRVPTDDLEDFNFCPNCGARVVVE